MGSGGFWDPGPPEEALAALAGHGVEVEAGGSVPADPADPGVPLGVPAAVAQGGAGSARIHGWERRNWDLSQKFRVFSLNST